MCRWKTIRNVYILNIFNPSEPGQVTCSTDLAGRPEWPNLFYHDGIVHIRCRQVVTGVLLGEVAKGDLCHLCATGTLTRTKLHKETLQFDLNILDVNHIDVCVAMEIVSDGSAKYFLLFIESWPKCTDIYPITSKSEVPSSFKEYLATGRRRIRWEAQKNSHGQWWRICSQTVL